MRKLLEHPLVLVLITITAGIFMFSLYVSAKTSSGGNETLHSLEESVEHQQARVHSLEQQVALSSDPFIQEKIQRDERLQQKPGEIVLQLPPINVPSPNPEPAVRPLSPWEEWQMLLFGRH